MCVGLPKTAEHLFLAALFFVSFFWASKRKKAPTRLLYTFLVLTKKGKKSQVILYPGSTS